MSDKDVNFSVGADSSAVDREFERLAQASMTTGQRMQSTMREASNRMQQSFNENTEKMNKGFDGLKSKIEGLRGQLAAVAAIAVGGKILKGMSDDSAALTIEHTKLAAQLGVSTSQVQVLDMALGDVHGTVEELKNAHGRINQALLNNEDAFHKLGVSTRDANGNFRSTMSVMADANSALLKFREGTDRNVEGMKIYGKQWPELMHLVGLTGDMLRDAEADARKFGLVLGVENVAAAKAYEKAMGDSGDMVLGLKKAVGDALMPVLTQLAQWFTSAAPVAITITKGAVGGLTSLFWGLRMAVGTVMDLIMLKIESVTARVSQLVNVTMAVLRGDWAGAKKAWDNGQAELEAISSRRFKNIEDRARETQEKLFGLFANPTATAAPDSGGMVSDGKEDTKTPKAAKSRTAEFDARLQDMKNAFAQEQALLGQFHEFSKERERDYWRTILDTVKLSAEERRSVLGKYLAAEKDLQKTAFDQQMAELKAQYAVAGAGGLERIRLAGEIAAQVGEKYGQESQQYREALSAMQQAAREHHAQMQQIETMAQERRRAQLTGDIQLQKLVLDEQEALGEISAQQRLLALARLKEQEFQLELQSAMDRAALLENDVVAYQQQMDRILEIKRRHELDMRTIQKEIAVANKADFDAMFEPISSAFDKSITGMIQGTQRWQDVVRNAGLNVVAQYASIGMRLMMQWVADEARKTMATAAGAQTRTGIEASAAAQSSALSGKSTLTSIMNDAYEAMAGAYSAIAGIPFVGPFLAPAVAAGAFAVVAGLAGNVMSAEGGYDIPSGINPMTQLHEKEMVLPAQHADVIRALSENGMSGNAAMAPVILKGTSAGEFFIANRKDLVKALGLASRDFMK